MCGTDFSSVYTGNVDSAVKEFNRIVLSLMDIACPLRRVKMSSRDPPYMSPLLKYLLRKKHRMCPGPQMREINARIHTEMLNSLRRKGLRKGSKNWWDQVNYVAGRGRTPQLPFEFDCEGINKAFCDIATTDETFVHKLSQSKAVLEVSLHPVYIGLRSLKQTATGCDGISVKFLREFAHILADHVHYLFNLSLECRTVPSIWNSANVVPLAKTSPNSMH